MIKVIYNRHIIVKVFDYNQFLLKYCYKVEDNPNDIVFCGCIRNILGNVATSYTTLCVFKMLLCLVAVKVYIKYCVVS